MWIGDVFGRERGEQIELDDIHLLFHRLPEMDVLESPDNHIILGAKGCGKSTALRALTFRSWRQRTPAEPLPFVGIYQPFQFDELSIFKTTYDACSTGLFEHYFAVTFLLNAVTQLTDALPEAFPLLDIVAKFFHERPSKISKVSEELLDERYALEKHLCQDPLVTKDGFLGRVDRLSIRSVQEFSTRFSIAARRFPKEVPLKIGILLDSFDYYGPLGGLVSPLFESDSGFNIVIKIAARRLNIREIFEGSNRRLERHRDYKLISLDRNSDNADHFSFVRDALCKRVRKFLRTMPPGTRDTEIIDALFFGTTADTTDTTSFENFCRVSSGNVLAVILLLNKAAELQRTASQTRLAGLTPILREYRLAAIREQSKHFWEYELGIRIPTHKSEADAFCSTALAMAGKSTAADSLSPQFTLAIVPDKSLVATMLSNRVLIAIDESINREVQAGYDPPSPLQFELNRLLLPRVDRLARPGAAIALDRQQFATNYKKALDERKLHMAPRSSLTQRELFGDGFTVFISMPFDAKKQARTSVVRLSLKRLYKDATQEPGGAGISHIDVKYLPRTGAFRLEIPDHIRNCSYMLADISDVSISETQVPGVFYEIGLAVGERKPLVLFYNRRETNGGVPTFNVEALPAILRGQSVLVWEKGSGNFHDIFRPVHQTALSYNGFVPASIGNNAPIHPPKYAYLSFRPRYERACQWFSDIVRKLFPELTIIYPRSWNQGELPEVRNTIANAQLCIIDSTHGVSDYALELGIATATGRRRVLQVWNTADDRSLEPIPMYPGKRWGWTDLSESDSRYLCGCLEQIAGQTNLGSRRK